MNLMIQLEYYPLWNHSFMTTNYQNEQLLPIQVGKFCHSMTFLTPLLNNIFIIHNNIKYLYLFCLGM